MPDLLRRQLDEGLEHLELPLSEQQRLSLLEYLSLIERWNRAYNLTAIREPEAMVARHLLESLAIAAFIPKGRILDVGTGAGLPGIPLAIAQPDSSFHLLDSNGKKTRFLFQVKSQLGLNNATVIHERVERHRDPIGFSGVVSRAYASLDKFINSCRHLVSRGGHLFAMKAAGVEEELSQLTGDSQLVGLWETAVPGLNGSRFLAEVALGGEA